MDRKLIILFHHKKILTALWENGEIVELFCEEEEKENRIGNIYVGRVRNVVKNINAAFVEFADGQVGYYALNDKQRPFFLNPKNTQKICCGDLLLVQIEKENMKTKAPVLTSRINLTGKYAVLTVGNHALSISSKISDPVWRTACAKKLRSLCTQEYGFIIRTNSYELPKEDYLEILKEEIMNLKQEYVRIKEQAVSRTAYSVLYQSPAGFLTALHNVYTAGLSEIITDNPQLYQTIKQFLAGERFQEEGKLRLYQDELLSLSALYSIERAVERALTQKVWLKSGGYLIIQFTEALTVIDVNTGKSINHQKREEHIYQINVEAAKEIGKQLRLRNLSGIIIVDFINMEQKEMQKELLLELEKVLRKDPVKTVIAGMTNLGLVELTRKKIRKPFHESMNAAPMR